MSRILAAERRPCVVKVGGSLFEFDGLSTALRQWIAGRRLSAPIVLLAGGGKFADAIRRYDARHALGEEASHWLCIRLLGVTARMLARLLPDAALVDEFEQLQSRLVEPLSVPLVFDPGPFLASAESELPGCRLPRSWQATSDSIAARVAEVLSADLVLLKSAGPPREIFPEGDRAKVFANLAAAGYVDQHFPRAAAAVRAVEIVNLRGLGSAASLREFRANRA